MYACVSTDIDPRQSDLRSETTRHNIGQGLSTQRKQYQTEIFPKGGDSGNNSRTATTTTTGIEVAAKALPHSKSDHRNMGLTIKGTTMKKLKTYPPLLLK